MRRYFNTEGRCRPQQHYMVGLDDRLDRIKRLLTEGNILLLTEGDNTEKPQRLWHWRNI